MLAARIKNEMLMSTFRDVVVYCCCLCYTVSQQINNSSLLNVVTSRVDQKGCGLRKDRFYMNIKSITLYGNFRTNVDFFIGKLLSNYNQLCFSIDLITSNIP